MTTESILCRHSYVLLVIFAMMVCIITAAVNIVELATVGKNAHYRPGSIIETFETSGVFFCGEACLRTTDCVDINYSVHYRRCQILKQDAVVGLKYHIHWTYITNLSYAAIKGSCKNKPCGTRQYCFDDVQNPGYYCAFIECDIPQPITNGTVKYTRRLIFDVAEHNCVPPYVAVGDRKSKCMPTGEWAQVPMKCRICDDVPEKPLAKPDKLQKTVGTIVKYSCESPELHNGVGKDTTTCSNNGQWTPSDFRCVDGWECYNYTSVDTGNMQTYTEQKVCEEMGTGTKKFTNGNGTVTPGCTDCPCCIRIP